jgi:hypothetical protein
MGFEGEQSQEQRLVEREAQRTQRLPERFVGGGSRALVEPEDAVAADVASRYARIAAADAGGMKFSRRIVCVRLFGQRGNGRLRQKISFDCATVVGDCRADPIDRGGHSRLSRITKWCDTFPTPDATGFPLSYQNERE